MKKFFLILCVLLVLLIFGSLADSALASHLPLGAQCTLVNSGDNAVCTPPNQCKDINAAGYGTCLPSAALCDESNGGTNGLVPCGNEILTLYGWNCHNSNATGSYLGAIIANTNRQTALSHCLIYYPGTTLVYLNGINITSLPCRCELYHIFLLVLNVYKFVIWTIAIPLAGLLIMIGGILLLISGGGAASIPGIAQGPNLYNTGKKIIAGAIFGLLLIMGSWVIINIVLMILGYQTQWFIF